MGKDCNDPDLCSDEHVPISWEEAGAESVSGLERAEAAARVSVPHLGRAVARRHHKLLVAAQVYRPIKRDIHDVRGARG